MYLIKKQKKKTEPAIVQLMYLVTLGLRNQGMIAFINIGGSLFLSGSFQWAVQVTSLVELSQWVYDNINKPFNLSVPYIVNYQGEFGYTPLGSVLLSIVIMLFPLIMYILFYIITLPFGKKSAKFFNIIAKIFVALDLFVIIFGNLLQIYILIDAKPYRILFEGYYSVMTEFLQAYGSELTHLNVASITALTLSVGMFIFSYHMQSIIVIDHRIHSFHNALDNASTPLSLRYNEVIKTLMLDASFKIKASVVEHLFNPEVMDPSKLSIRDKINLYVYRQSILINIRHYSNEYNYIFKRKTYDQYLEIYKINGVWSKEQAQEYHDKIYFPCRLIVREYDENPNNFK